MVDCLYLLVTLHTNLHRYDGCAHVTEVPHTHYVE